MKKIILPIFFLLFSAISQAESIKISTVLKPPINTFNRLQLIPRNNVNPNTCPRGTVYLDDATRDVMVCTGGVPTTTHSPWTQNGNLIYLRDWSNPNVKVGIGTSTPDKKFEVTNETIPVLPGTINSFQIDTKDAEQNLGINLITRGVPTPLPAPTPSVNWAAFIDFRLPQLLPATPANSGRIIYADRRDAALTPWARSGLGISTYAPIISDPNIFDVWMDAENGNVGLGVGVNPADLARVPAEQLEVNNGNLKTDRAFLTATDGSQTAELKTTYIAGRGYYAVLAP